MNRLLGSVTGAQWSGRMGAPASEGEAGCCNKTAAKVRAFYADNSVAKSKKMVEVISPHKS